LNVAQGWLVSDFEHVDVVDVCRQGARELGLLENRPTWPRAEALNTEGFGVLQKTGNAELAQLAHDVNERLQRVKALLSAPSTTSSRG